MELASILLFLIIQISAGLDKGIFLLYICHINDN